MPWRTIPLDRGDAGVRVDRVLLRHLSDVPRVSRTRIQQWIEGGRVLVNGRPAPRAAWRVAAGDELLVELPDAPPRRTMAAEARPLDILFEDEHLLAVDKPAGLIVHPSYKHASGTLMNALLAHTPTPGLVHRLDKQTSGLVLVAKRREVHAALQRAMQRNAVTKEYLAIVLGRPTPARGTIDLALDRDPWDRRRVMVRDRGGQPSVTRYEVVARSRAGLALVRCRLITGRMHQIRVHMAARGWPVVGDPVYGPDRLPPLPAALGEACQALGRQALHAWRLAFAHPVTRAPIEIVAEVPADMARVAELAGLSVPAELAPARERQ